MGIINHRFRGFTRIDTDFVFATKRRQDTKFFDTDFTDYTDFVVATNTYGTSEHREHEEKKIKYQRLKIKVRKNAKKCQKV